jgi:hypothetical protein
VCICYYVKPFLMLNCILHFIFHILYGKKCEGVSRNEGSKELPVFHFWRHLLSIVLTVKVYTNFIPIYQGLFLDNRVFRPLPTLFYLLIVYFTYLNYNTIFLMWDIRSYLRDLWVLFSFAFGLIILITWLFKKILWLYATGSLRTTFDNSYFDNSQFSLTLIIITKHYSN